MPINELRSITTFVRTAELGNLRKAATAQSITPQAASQALAQSSSIWGFACFTAPRGAWRSLKKDFVFSKRPNRPC